MDVERRLTPLGRELARLPLDPRIGRIVLAARDGGCLAEALVIASALAVPDPRERPLERRRRPTRRTSGFATSGRTSCRWSRCGSSLPRRMQRAVAPQAGRRVPRPVRLLASAARVARRAPAAGRDARGGRLEVGSAAAVCAGRRALRPPAQGGAGRTARQHRRQVRRRRALPRHARSQVLPASGFGAFEEGAAPSGSSPPNSRRRRGSSRAAQLVSSPSGSRKSPATA